VTAIPTLRAKFLREYFFSSTQKGFYFFSGPFGVLICFANARKLLDLEAQGE